jgi:hypothetical protein
MSKFFKPLVLVLAVGYIIPGVLSWFLTWWVAISLLVGIGWLIMYSPKIVWGLLLLDWLKNRQGRR